VKLLWVIALLAGLLFAGGLLGLDRVVASWSVHDQAGESIFGAGTGLMDLLALKEISNFLLGLLLLAVAIGLLIVRATRGIGWPLLYVAAVQFAATIVADLSKPQFGRLRPDEATMQSAGADTWFVGANAFPSGHTAFYAGLFFPLLLLLPRWAVVWLLPPLFIAIARVVQHDHYLSDVAASIALAALLSIGLSFILRRDQRRTTES
jgi:membrane-associated phospholipid phosphatase